MHKREVITRLPGPRTDPQAGFSPVAFSSEVWDSILGRFEPTDSHRFEIVMPKQEPKPIEPKKLDLHMLGTKHSPTIAVLRQALKDKGLTLPKGVELKKDIEAFILANSEAFS